MSLALVLCVIAHRLHDDNIMYVVLLVSCVFAFWSEINSTPTHLHMAICTM